MMAAVDGSPGRSADGLAGLPGLEAVTGQLAGWVAVLHTEQARRRAGATVIRPTWKNLVFTGGAGAGKSRAARALARTYHQLGVLPQNRVFEVAAADLTGGTVRETGILMGEAARHGLGGILMITGAHAWLALPDRGQQVLRYLYTTLTEARDLLHDDLAVIVAGRAGPVHDLLAASPALAARFPVTIDFPGYTPAQLAAIFDSLGRRGRVHPRPRRRSQSSRRARRGRRRPQLGQRPAGGPAAGPGHRQPRPPDHCLRGWRRGRAEHDLRGRYPLVPAPARTARGRPAARSVPVKACRGGRKTRRRWIPGLGRIFCEP